MNKLMECPSGAHFSESSVGCLTLQDRSLIVPKRRAVCLGFGASPNAITARPQRPAQEYSAGEALADSKLNFGEFPQEIQERILANLPYEEVFRLTTLSKAIIGSVKSDEFQASPSRKKPSLTACYFFIDGGVWKWAGFDPSSKEWRLLPPLTYLSENPDPELFKEFLICAKNGLVCMNFSKSPDRERLVVFNPLSRVWLKLPDLNHQRNPVLMHMLVDPVTKAYQVIVAGSSKSGHKDLSRITEVYDSCTGVWKRTGDLLGPAFSLNEFQSGVYQDGKVFCIGFVEENGRVGKGIMAYDVEQGKWSSTWMHLLPFCASSSILQLIENQGEVFLFSERESDRSVEHCVERVEWTQANEETKPKCQLTSVIQYKKSGGKSLEVYPEFTCVPYDEGRLCIVNAIDHTGKVYDVRNPDQDAVPLPEVPADHGFRGGLGFFTLNPLSFPVEPRFSRKVNRLKSEQLKHAESDQGSADPIRSPEEARPRTCSEDQGRKLNNTNKHDSPVNHNESFNNFHPQTPAVQCS